MFDGSRPSIWLEQGHSFKLRLIRRFGRRQLNRRLDRWRVHDNWNFSGQLTGIQNDLFRPFLRRFDPDNRSIEGDRLISEHRWGLWQKPAGDEQQSRKRASNEDKIAGYRHRYRPRQLSNATLPRTPEKPNGSPDFQLLGQRRRCNDGHWPYFDHEHYESEHPDREYGHTQYAPHICSCAVSVSLACGASTAGFSRSAFNMPSRC